MLAQSLLLGSEHFLTGFEEGTGGMRRGRSGRLASARAAWAGMPGVPGRSAPNPLALFPCDSCQWANLHVLLQ